MSEKGQVVIPRKIRETLNIKPKTRFEVYARNNAIVLKAIDLPCLEQDLSSMFKTIQAKNHKLSEKDVYDARRAYRANKRR